jgi:molybdopterin-guanine dinucleotide biosynthesis protein A
MPDLGGILVGGRGRRMGGVAKGLLFAPSGETLMARWQRLFTELGWPSVIVGQHEAYAGTAIERLEDDPPDIGPLGGVVTLLTRADQGRAIVVACDMPFVSIELLAKLASHPSGAAALAPRRNDLWEPLFARYDAPRVLSAAKTRAHGGEHSLQGLLDAVGTDTLPLESHEWSELDDWDRPEDITRHPT